jgi:hypoxanthine phosphoribosyltransferase
MNKQTQRIIYRELGLGIISIFFIILYFLTEIDKTFSLSAFFLFLGIIFAYGINEYQNKENIEKIQVLLNEANKTLTSVSWDQIKSNADYLREYFNKKEFFPDIVFTPCKRGATIVNLMYGVNETVLLYTGIRIRKHEKTPPIANWEKEWESVQTDKYYSYIPKSMIELAKRNDNLKLLIIDDFAETGQSLDYIKNFLGDHNFNPDNIKTATIVANRLAIKNMKLPDEAGIKTNETEFTFPWGRAV